jgi:hypothetical protein
MAVYEKKVILKITPPYFCTFVIIPLCRGFGSSFE